MLALAFSFLVFVFWACLGRAVISVVYPRLGVLRSWLLAPAIGLSVVLLGLMIFNQLGIPILRFATPLTLVLALAAAVVLLRGRPTTPWRKGAWFAGATVFALLAAGWPAFGDGFNWISYANDDMANYCLAAQRFMDHGFYDVPTMAELAGRDYSSYYFFMHVADMMRFGAEHLVAWSASIAHVAATQAFMPTILALSLVQVAAIGGLVLHLGRWRKRSLLTMWLLAASPMFMLGTLYQLIAQVGGVALLLTVIALLTRPWVSPRRRSLIRYALLPAIASTALCIFYPEVTPFAGLTFVAFMFVWILRKRAFPAALVALAAYTLVGVVILLRHNLISYVSILVVQFNGAMDSSNLLLSLFPYFMLPTGFSNLFGWMPIAHDFSEPAVSLSIVVGMVLAVVILARAVREAWRLTPAALLLLIQFAFAIRLFKGANDFGLYKLAMWMQPVLVAGLAGLLLWLARGRRRVLAAAFIVCVLAMAPTAYYYADSSRGLRSGGLTELRMASRLGLKADVPADTNAQLTTTIENVVAAKFAASVLRSHPLALVSRDFFWPTTRTDFVNPTWPVRIHPHFQEMSQAAPLITERNRDLVVKGVLWDTQFTQPVVNRPTDYYVSMEPHLSLFNKFNLGAEPRQRSGVFLITPASAVHNRLLFVHSGRGNHYYLGDRRKISFFQQEQDLFAPGHDFNGIGRFMLLRIENPSPRVYLRFAGTRTFMTGRTSWNPAAVVRGETDVPLGAVGDGAFNLFVGPLTPKRYGDAWYLAIDLQEMPRQLLDYRTGLKLLYNRKVPLDYRRLVGWARDISALSEEEVAALNRPRVVSKFPEELALAHDLEFAGAYEDGWLSPHSRFVLAGAQTGDLVRLRGVVPLIPDTPLGTGTLRVKINGIEICTLAAPVGTFDWLVPVPQPCAKTDIELEFSASTPLPGRDKRPASAKIDYVGFADSRSVSNNYNELGRPKLIASGIDQDGWMVRNAAMILPPSTSSQRIRLNFEYPSRDGAQPGSLRVLVDGSPFARTVDLKPGTPVELAFDLPPSSTNRVLRFEAPAEYPLSAPDTRQRSLRIATASIGSVE